MGFDVGFRTSTQPTRFMVAAKLGSGLDISYSLKKKLENFFLNFNSFFQFRKHIVNSWVSYFNPTYKAFLLLKRIEEISFLIKILKIISKSCRLG
jgi:hypothetical protein